MYTSGDYTFSPHRHLILPAIAAGAMTLGIMTDGAQLSLRDAQPGFVTTLRAKGLSEPAIMRHVLRNSLPHAADVAGLVRLPDGRSTMVETIFPGRESA